MTVKVKLYRLVFTAALVAAVTSCSTINTFTTDSDTVVQDPDIPATNISIDKDEILASHNSIRKRLGVPPLRWSTRLQALSADWANYLVSDAGCTLRRRGSIGLPAHKNGIGENLQFHEPVRFDDGRVEVADVGENDVVVAWAKQALDFDYKKNQCASNKQCDNYTQVVWRDSQVLGCAAASCPGMEQIWVCHYDPPGNFLNQKPY